MWGGVRDNYACYLLLTVLKVRGVFSRLDFRRPPSPLFDPSREAHFLEQRLVIEPTIADKMS